MTRRSYTNGFQAKRTAAAARGSGDLAGVSRAAPAAPPTKTPARASFWTRSAGTSRLARATSRSAGTALATAVSRPSRPRVSSRRGTNTMS
jgi:hypothetical protein